MKTIKEYLLENKVKKKTPDLAEASSLAKQAVNRFEDLIILPLNEKNAAFRFESAYESVRELIQAFMAKEGFKPYFHEAVVAYAKEKMLLNEREIINFDRYREKRNTINYHGQPVSLEEAQQIIFFAKEIIPKLKDKLFKK